MKGGYKCSGNSDHKFVILAGGLVESQTEMVVALEHDFEREESCDTVHAMRRAPRATGSVRVFERKTMALGRSR